jgi:MerR family transcriptional regulator, redox-sensitive transcriptional activator SoxR
MAGNAAQLTIGEVAQQAGMRTSRIRYYESVGVLPAPQRVAGMRRYSPDVLRRLGIIDVAQRVGFTLEEIRELLNSEHGTAHHRLQHLAQRKLPDIDELIQRAKAVRRWLEMTSACECESLDVCSLFDDRVLALDDKPSLQWRQVVLEPIGERSDQH